MLQPRTLRPQRHRPPQARWTNQDSFSCRPLLILCRVCMAVLLLGWCAYARNVLLSGCRFVFLCTGVCNYRGARTYRISAQPQRDRESFKRWRRQRLGQGQGTGGAPDTGAVPATAPRPLRHTLISVCPLRRTTHARTCHKRKSEDVHKEHGNTTNHTENENCGCMCRPGGRAGQQGRAARSAKVWRVERGGWKSARRRRAARWRRCRRRQARGLR